ncbi:MAG: proline racemase family protein, partial [Pirellula sp.]
CGTGTSAKLACLAADKKLKPKTVWRQESYIGSSFEAEFQWHDEPHGVIAPSITSRAFVNADLQVLCHDEDPFAWGISTTR